MPKLNYLRELKIKEFCKLVSNGVTNGIMDSEENKNDINFFKKKADMYEAFHWCILDLLCLGGISNSEEQLRKIVQDGYSQLKRNESKEGSDGN